MENNKDKKPFWDIHEAENEGQLKYIKHEPMSVADLVKYEVCKDEEAAIDWLEQKPVDVHIFENEKSAKEWLRLNDNKIYPTTYIIPTEGKSQSGIERMITSLLQKNGDAKAPEFKLHFEDLHTQKENTALIAALESKYKVHPYTVGEDYSSQEVKRGYLNKLSTIVAYTDDGSCYSVRLPHSTMVVKSGHPLSSEGPLETAERLFALRQNIYEVDLRGLRLKQKDNTPSFSRVFYQCSNLETAYMDDLRTKNVKKADRMFDGCKSLKEAHYTGWNANAIETTERMHSGNESLEKVDLGGWVAVSNRNMSHMFFKCQSLNEIKNMENFTPNNVETMESAWSGCRSLPSLNLDSWRPEKLTNLQSAWEDCEELKELNLKGWHTPELKDINSAFFNNFKLEKLDLSSMHPAAVEDTANMFYGCKNLKELNISNFDMSHVKNYTAMFLGVNEDVKITCDADFRDWALDHAGTIGLPKGLQDRQSEQWHITGEEKEMKYTAGSKEFFAIQWERQGQNLEAKFIDGQLKNILYNKAADTMELGHYDDYIFQPEISVKVDYSKDVHENLNKLVETAAEKINKAAEREVEKAMKSFGVGM